MKNVDVKVDGDILTITVDLAQNHGPSASGKTMLVATSGGNKQIDDAPGTYIGLNVYRYADK